MAYDIWNGNWEDAAWDAAAMCVPGVPAGITKLRKIKNAPKSDLPRGPGGEYLPHPDAVGPHSTIGTRMGSDGNHYRQGATFDGNGNFRGRTDVTDHGSPHRPGHVNPHHHPATGPASTGSGVPGHLPFP